MLAARLAISDALLFVLEAEEQVEPFSADALAGAAFRMLRSERFAPAPDKLVEALRDEARAYETAPSCDRHGARTPRRVAGNRSEPVQG